MPVTFARSRCAKRSAKTAADVLGPTAAPASTATRDATAKSTTERDPVTGTSRSPLRASADPRLS